MDNLQREVVPVAQVDELQAVRLDDPAELQAWTLLLGCTVSELRAAVAAVGTDPIRIEAFLASPAG